MFCLTLICSQGNAETFVAHYYRLVDAPAIDVGTLATVYRDGSCLTTAQGDQIRGGASIAACLSRRAAAGAGGLTRTVRTLDVLPGGVEGGMLVITSGTLSGGVGMGVAGVGGSHGDARRHAMGEEGEGVSSFEFRETFLVFQVHAGWVNSAGSNPSGDKFTDTAGQGQFYVRNQIERWSRRGDAYPA